MSDFSYEFIYLYSTDSQNKLRQLRIKKKNGINKTIINNI